MNIVKILCCFVCTDVLKQSRESSWVSIFIHLFISSHLTRGDISEASIILGRSNQTNNLRLAAQLAKLAGHNTFATSIEARVQSQMVHETEEELEDLPSRIEALLNANDGEETESEEEVYEEIIVEKSAVNGNCMGDGIAVVNVTKPIKPLNGNVLESTNGKVLIGDGDAKDEVKESEE